MKKKMEPKLNPKTTWKLHENYLKTTYCDPGTYVCTEPDRERIDTIKKTEQKGAE
jgi:hypothetical protein